jgi:PAS domain S-box-containing protein
MSVNELQRQIELLTRRAERERRARKEAEALLESKSLELFRANQALQKAASNMEERVQERTRKLQESQHVLQEAQRVGNFGHWTWDAATDRSDWSDGLFRVFGYAPGEIVPSQTALKLRIHPEDLRRLESVWDSKADRTRVVHNSNYRIVLPDGAMRHIIEITQLRRDAAGNIVHMIGVAQDVTDRIAADARLALQAEILRSVGNVVLVADSTGAIVYVSPSVTSVLGYTPEELLHDGWWRIKRKTSQEHLNAERDYIKLAASGDVASDSTPHEHCMQHKDGTWRWLLISDAKGPDNLVIGVCTDVTARKRAEDELRANEQRYRMFVESASDMIYRTDRNGRFIYANPVAMRIMGFKSEADFLGKRFFDFIREDMRKQIRQEYLHQYQTREKNTYYELPVIGANQRELWLGQNVQVLIDGDVVIGFQGVARDITDRKAMEKQLALARDQALEASRLKSEFLAMMSHEIRTPMNAVIGMNELLLQSSLDDRQRELTHLALTSAHTLLGLINDILDFSKIEAGKLSIDSVEFDLRNVIETTVNIVKPKALEKRLPIRVTLPAEMPQHLIGDPGRVRQVMLNLMSNAVKFTERGQVDLVVTVADVDAREITYRFEVRDTGIGLSATARRRLFRPFVQADGSTTRRYGGTGLGLAISRNLVELMGGQIDVESEEDKGSCFTFTLVFAHAQGALMRSDYKLQGTAQANTVTYAVDAAPTVAPVAEGQSDAGVAEQPIEAALSTSASQVRPAAPAAAAAGSKRLRNTGGMPRILLVEDNPANQRMAVLQLDQIGLTAQIACNGREAITALVERAAAGQPFELVLMDCQMPEMDGFTATREIRKIEAGQSRHTPIVAMTANAMRGDRESCIAAGMDDYISKPVRLTSLREIVQTWLAAWDKEIVMLETVDADGWLAFSEALGGDAEAMRDVASAFIDETERLIADLHEAIADKDVPRTRHAAHSIKGGAATVGATVLSQLAFDVEGPAREGSLDGAAANARALAALFARVRQDITERLNALTNVDVPVT